MQHRRKVTLAVCPAEVPPMPVHLNIVKLHTTAAHRQYAIYNVDSVSAPGYSAMIFLVMEIKDLTTISFQLMKDGAVLYRKGKLVALKIAVILASEALLYQFTFICFKDIPFIDGIVQHPGLDTGRKNIVIFKIDEKACKQDEDNSGDGQELFHASGLISE